MINKLYNLKKLQTQQQILQRQQLLSNIASIDEDIENTTQNISKATVQTLGAISDFRILEIHKNTMKEHISKLNQKKSYILKEIEQFNNIIVELNKETEQFKYIKVQKEKERFKQIIKSEDEMASEYVQSQWNSNQ